VICGAAKDVPGGPPSSSLTMAAINFFFTIPDLAV
jgi:hypothetical protein